MLSPVAPRSILSGFAASAGVTSPRRDGVESALRKTFGARDVVLTDSGTSALVLALRLTQPQSASVAMPAYACVDLMAAALHAGVTVRLYDTDPETLGPDLASVRAACARGARTIVVAPLYGYPIDMPAIQRVAAEYGAFVIEDAAQGAGGTLEGVRSGSGGHVAVLSFGRGKGTTGGSGGALLVHDASLSDATATMRSRLETPTRGTREVIVLAAQWFFGRPALYALPASIPALKLGETVYHPAHDPRGIAAAASRVVVDALARDPEEVAQRRTRAQRLARAAARRFAAVRPIPGADPGYLRLALRTREAHAESAPRLGALRGYPSTLDEYEETRAALAAGEQAGHGARELRDRLLTVPTHSRVGPGDLARLEAWLETPAVAATAHRSLRNAS